MQDKEDTQELRVATAVIKGKAVKEDQQDSEGCRSPTMSGRLNQSLKPLRFSLHCELACTTFLHHMKMGCLSKDVRSMRLEHCFDGSS